MGGKGSVGEGGGVWVGGIPLCAHEAETILAESMRALAIYLKECVTGDYHVSGSC